MDSEIAFNMRLRCLDFPNKNTVGIKFPLIFVCFAFIRLFDKIADILRV